MRDGKRMGGTRMGEDFQIVSYLILFVCPFACHIASFCNQALARSAYAFSEAIARGGIGFYIILAGALATAYPQFWRCSRGRITAPLLGACLLPRALQGRDGDFIALIIPDSDQAPNSKTTKSPAKNANPPAGSSTL